MTDTNTPASTPRKPPRRIAREYALLGIYQSRIGGDDAIAIEAHLPDLAGLVDTFLEGRDNENIAPLDPFDRADRTLCLRLLRGVLAQQPALIEVLQPNLDRPFTELSPIEASSLLLGAFELTHSPEIPYRVVINECIELAKSFGGTDGHKFVNGVLDKLAGKLRPVEVEARRAGNRPS